MLTYKLGFRPLSQTLLRLKCSSLILLFYFFSKEITIFIKKLLLFTFLQGLEEGK